MKLILPHLLIFGPDQPRTRFWFNWVKYALLAALVALVLYDRNFNQRLTGANILNFEYRNF